MQKIYGIHTVLALLQTKPELVRQLYLQTGREGSRLQMLHSFAERDKIPLNSLTRSKLDALLPEGVQHQGVIAEVSHLPSYSENDLEKFLKIDNVLLLILDGVQDPHNLGACLRSANALGVHAVIVPKDRAVGLTPTVRKVACGAAEITPLVSVTNLARTLKQIKEQGVWLVGAVGEESVVISEIDLTGSIGLVMGAEGKGLRRLTRELCDYRARIPMLGSVSSFNVSVATGICLYEINRQRK